MLMENIVVQFGNRVVKGCTDAEVWFTAVMSDGGCVPPPVTVSIGSMSELVALEGAKAVFFVKSLEGTSHEDLRFSDHLQPMATLWIRVTYLDGEVIEGIIRNDSNFAFKQHFFMVPVDPEGNNTLILVIKSQLTHLQILGLRNPPMNLPQPVGDRAHLITVS
jgi:hypothetical protein